MTTQLRPDISQDTNVLFTGTSTPDCLLLCTDAEVLASLKVLFTDMDLPVEICADAEDAFARLQSRRFRAVIVDCDLPEGPALMRRIRESPDFQGTVRFALVGENTSMREMSKLGATLVAHKPLHPRHARKSLHAMQSLSGLRRRRTPRTALLPFAYITPGARYRVAARMTRQSHASTTHAIHTESAEPQTLVTTLAKFFEADTRTVFATRRCVVAVARFMAR